MRKLSLIVFLVFMILGAGYVLSLVFSGSLILPQFFKAGPLLIRYYGVIIALAVAAAFFLAMKRAELFGVGQKQAEDFLFWSVIGGFIGARLYHVLSSFSFYFSHPIDVFKVWNGGLSIYGAVIGGIIAIEFCRRFFNFQSSILNVLDWLIPSVVLGQIIGRLGNLFNYEAYGYPTPLPWKMFVPEIFRPEAYQSFQFFHPWFLYEIIGNLLVLFLILKKGKPQRPGLIAFYYLLLYNAIRFVLEFVRIDSTFIFGLRLNAVVSLAVFLGAALYIYFDNKKNAKIP